MSIMPVSEEQLRAQAKQRQEVQEKQRARRYDRVQPLPERGQDEEEEEQQEYSKGTQQERGRRRSEEDEQQQQQQQQQQQRQQHIERASSPRSFSSPSPSPPSSPTLIRRSSTESIPGKVPGGGLKGKSGWIMPDTGARLRLRERVESKAKKKLSVAELGRNPRSSGGGSGGGGRDDNGGGGESVNGSSAAASSSQVQRTDSLYHDATRRALRRELAKGMMYRQEASSSTIMPNRGTTPATAARHGVSQGSTSNKPAPFADRGTWELLNPYLGSPPQLPRDQLPGERNMDRGRDKQRGPGGGMNHSPRNQSFDDRLKETVQAGRDRSSHKARFASEGW